MSVQTAFLESLESYRQALNALLNDQPHGLLESVDKLRYTKQLFRTKDEMIANAGELVNLLRGAGLDTVQLLEMLEYCKIFLDARFYDVYPKVVATVKASMDDDDVHHWVVLAKKSKAKHRRVRAEYVFGKLDGKEQKALLEEFEHCKEYGGTTFPTAKEAAIAKIMKKLSHEKA